MHLQSVVVEVVVVVVVVGEVAVEIHLETQGTTLAEMFEEGMGIARLESLSPQAACVKKATVAVAAVAAVAVAAVAVVAVDVVSKREHDTLM